MFRRAAGVKQQKIYSPEEIRFIHRRQQVKRIDVSLVTREKLGNQISAGLRLGKLTRTSRDD